MNDNDKRGPVVRCRNIVHNVQECGNTGHDCAHTTKANTLCKNWISARINRIPSVSHADLFRLLSWLSFALSRSFCRCCQSSTCCMAVLCCCRFRYKRSIRDAGMCLIHLTFVNNAGEVLADQLIDVSTINSALVEITLTSSMLMK